MNRVIREESHSHHEGGFMSPEAHHDMFGHQGLVFRVQSKSSIELPEGIDLIRSRY